VHAPLELLTVFPYLPVLGDPEARDMVEMRDRAREALLQLGADLRDVAVADAQVIAGTTPARVLQEASERPDAGLLVIGSTTRGRLRRVLA
jgi:nucleotide-binding universal stress UspA family protein